MVRRRDSLVLICYGVNCFVPEKLARMVKLSNSEVYASMRGETLEQFLTCNVLRAR